MRSPMWVKPEFRESAILGWSASDYSCSDVSKVAKFKQTGLIDDLPDGNIRNGAIEWAQPFTSNVVLADDLPSRHVLKRKRNGT